jgi:hypothetical protein
MGKIAPDVGERLNANRSPNACYTSQLVTNVTQEEDYRTKEVNVGTMSGAARTMR